MRISTNQLSKLSSEKTQYKYVRKSTTLIKGKVVTKYEASISTTKIRKHLGTFELDKLREAALAVDKYLIDIGKEPVNILKRMI